MKPFLDVTKELTDHAQRMEQTPTAIHIASDILPARLHEGSTLRGLPVVVNSFYPAGRVVVVTASGWRCSGRAAPADDLGREDIDTDPAFVAITAPAERPSATLLAFPHGGAMSYDDLS